MLCNYFYNYQKLIPAKGRCALGKGHFHFGLQFWAAKGLIRCLDYRDFVLYFSEDILWFKPVELYTKYGRRGNIKEALGELTKLII